jgi:carboxymethylenebutenolidase
VPDVTIATANGPMHAYLAAPTAADGPRPGVVVIHDALGMTTDLCRQADWLADAGYLALAPDLYHWGSRMRCLLSAMRAMAVGRGRTFQDIDAARTWLTDRDDCTGRIGVIGFCLGGGFALALSAVPGYAASSVNYGSIARPDDVLAHACPIVGSYGGRDRSLKGTPQQLERILAANDIPHDIATYPDAGHSFLNDHQPGEMPAWARVSGSFVHAGYHEPSAVDARRRIARFFDTHLKA